MSWNSCCAHIHSQEPDIGVKSISPESDQEGVGITQDLRDLFRLEPAELEVSVTQRQLDAQHGHQRNYSPELTQHLKFLQGIRSFAGT